MPSTPSALYCVYSYEKKNCNNFHRLTLIVLIYLYERKNCKNFHGLITYCVDSPVRGKEFGLSLSVEMFQYTRVCHMSLASYVVTYLTPYYAVLGIPKVSRILHAKDMSLWQTKAMTSQVLSNICCCTRILILHVLYSNYNDQGLIRRVANDLVD